MELIFNWIETLTPFQQSILGSAVFAFSSIIAQKIYKKLKAGGSEFWNDYTNLDIHKHILHKHYVRSSNIQMSSYGSSIALLIAARWAMLSILALIFAFGVNSAIEGKWIYVVGAWIAFNWMLEARNWVKDSADLSNVSHIPQEKIEEVTKQLLSQPETEVNPAEHN
ncbi:hypothetical protein ABGI61_15420 [Rheinheimera sp. FR7-31]|uniref:hypothetical protein n=1 Tax=Rheinheimera fenheensis TaxID=3152295 RepID=UPI00325D663D